MYVINDFKVDDDKIINFTSGLPGFEGLKKYTILSIDDFEPFEIMYCADSDFELKFVLLRPQLILDDFSVSLKVSDKEELCIDENDEILEYLVITVDNDDITKSTANMLGPIVVNATKMIGKQLLLDENKFNSQFPIFQKQLATNDDNQGGK